MVFGVLSHMSSQQPVRVRIDRPLIERDGIHDVLARLAWASAGETVEVEMDFEPPSRVEVPEALSDGLEALCGNLRFVKPRGGRSGAGLVLVRDEAAKAAAGPGAFVFSRFEATEGNDATRLVHYARRREIKAIRSASRRRLWEWSEAWGGFSKSYLVATGPSFERHAGIDDFDGAFVVTCNSAVIDREFMDRARPSLVVFGDPIFHFGPSRYASEFRARLRAAASEYDFRIAVSEKYCFLFSHCFPELVERTVFVPLDGARKDFHWQLDRELVVKATKNILTLLMVPFAACFSRRLEILGCDGRRLADDGYFWGHSTAAQINDRMRNIQEVHPGFFAIDYNDYYLTHCRQLERFFGDLERSGIEVASVAPSCIPALAKRAVGAELAKAVDEDTANALLSEGERRMRTRVRQLDRTALSGLRFVSVNPSLRGGLGHALYQDLAIREVVCPDGAGFVSLGDAGLEEELSGRFALPVFETKIWQVHRRTGKERQALAESFVAELFSGLELLDGASSLEEATVFFYLGHPALLPAFIRRWETKRFRCRRFVFNLFSGFFEGVRSGSSGDAVFHSLAQLAERASGFGDLALVCDSSPLVGDIRRAAGLGLSLLPMCPSQSFPEGGVEGARDAARAAGGRIRVVYPSQSEEIRGFDVLSRFLFRHAEEFSDVFDFVVRLQPARGSANFKKRNLSWVRGVLSVEEYAELLAGADIVLLPYSPEAFHYRTSSILAEAFSLGKPVVAVSDSWLGLQVSKSGGGWLADSWDSDGLREVFAKIAAAPEQVAALQGAAPMKAWCEENRVENFVRAVLEASPAELSEERAATYLCEQALFRSAAAGSSAPSRSRLVLARKKLAEAMPLGLKQSLWRYLAWCQRWVREGRRLAKRGVSLLVGKGGGARQDRRDASWVSLDAGGISPGAPPEAHLRLDDAALLRRLGGISSGAEVKISDRKELETVLSDADASRPPALLCARGALDSAEAMRSSAGWLEEAGYQVWVCQWHPEPLAGGGLPWFRIFPYPSLPFDDMLPTSLMAFRVPVGRALVEKEVNRLLRRD